MKLYKQKLSHKVEKSRLVNKNTSSICLDFQRREPSSGSINFLVYWDLGIFGLGQKKDTFGDSLGLLSKEAKLFVGWVSGSVTHAGVGFHASTQPTFSTKIF
ncbi:hypothetical protein MICAF_2940018 [Microcystis aeruginosa PCC 9807]|uniref:Uncharacterized protein n=1 Tax=Microcystis aeruginosa PCC 9807 TaxID=1160283 RepID=I4H6A0_MICAE|nr:MAG: hypothetical protein EWV83_13715 [Microcystis sp. M_OC_Ca_00000000_S217Cul]TRT86525.1 MAG: hypothetical protein EWV66_15945 [Microcystis sp. M_OC_Ca_00000000_C217Col]CCI17574.1 hypothetical protein MICAF_2940018 [Microcystis aeruginosa PCC 9807]